ncbi:MAG: hypothetical protein GEU93_22390, partial [Propionibacteriales bacterium]|nr:hypothetical protein [Propionibacteriales bacterium]
QVRSFLDEWVPECRRRWAMGRAVDASEPGLQRFVQFDESRLPDWSPETGREWGEQAAELLRQASDEEGEGLSDEEMARLNELLSEAQHDPYFAHALAEGVSAEELANLPLGGLRHYGDSAQVDTEALAMTMGLASTGREDLALDRDLADEFSDVICDVDYGEDAEPSRLGYLISQGYWDGSFLTTVGERILEEEDGNGQSVWENIATTASAGPGPGPQYRGAALENGEPYPDPLAGVLEAMQQNPAAAQEFLTAGDLTEIERADGTTQEVSERLHYLMMERGWEFNPEAFRDAVASAALPFEGGSTEFASQVRNLAEYAEEQAEAADKPWYVDIGHAILDIGGLVPLIGEGADAINSAWYAAEGDFVNAGLSAAGMIPFAGWGATGGKWVLKNLDHVDDAGDLARLVDPAVNPPPLPDFGDIPFQRGTDEWAEAVSERYPTLTKDDVLGIHDYTTEGGYSAMNNYLRNPDSVSPAAREAIEARIERASAGLSKLPRYQGETFRGTNLPDDVLARWQPGETVSDAAFTSSSTTAPVAERFARGKNAFIRIVGRNGRDVQQLSHYGDEAEVLFDRATQFRVLRRAWNDDLGRWEFTVMEVAQ